MLFTQNINGMLYFIKGITDKYFYLTRLKIHGENNFEGFDGLMGAINTRGSLSPLHSEIEALSWTIECMRNLRQFHLTFAINYSQLIKMVSEPEEWPAFESYLEDIRILKGSFNHLKIIHIPRTQNTKTDSLVRRAMQQSFHVVHMDAELPICMQSLSWVCFCWCQKKITRILLTQSFFNP